MDDKGQMMILEVVLFAILIIVALIFLYQLSPPSSVGNVYTDELKIQGDSALHDLCNDHPSDANLPTNYPLDKLSHYLVTNDYYNLTLDIDDLLSTDVMYNIWICNATTSMFWCNSSYGNSYTPIQNAEPLNKTGSVTVSNCIIAIDPVFRDNNNGVISNQYHQGRYNNKSDLFYIFDKYNGSTYNVILEMWEI